MNYPLKPDYTDRAESKEQIWSRVFEGYQAMTKKERIGVFVHFDDFESRVKREAWGLE